MSASANKRRLKIYYGYNGKSNKKLPYIRLCGDYLSQMNFKIGDEIQIIVEQNHIFISKVLPKQT